jgi:hypothetical protein
LRPTVTVRPIFRKPGDALGHGDAITFVGGVKRNGELCPHGAGVAVCGVEAGELAPDDAGAGVARATRKKNAASIMELQKNYINAVSKACGGHQARKLSRADD